MLSKVFDVVRLLEYARRMKMEQTRPENRRDRELLAAERVARTAAAADRRSQTSDDSSEMHVRRLIRRDRRRAAQGVFLGFLDRRGTRHDTRYFRMNEDRTKDV